MNQYAVKDQRREKARSIIQKLSDRLEHVTQNSDRKNLRILIQKEVGHLRYLDSVQNRDILKTKKLKQNLKIAEKHMALNIINNEKKIFR